MNEVAVFSFLTVMAKSLVSTPLVLTSSKSDANDHSLVTSKVVGLSVRIEASQMQKTRAYLPFQLPVRRARTHAAHEQMRLGLG